MNTLDELIIKCRKRDTRARQQIYILFAPKLRAMCRRYIADVNDVQDVLHDSFITIFEKIEQCKDNSTFEAWMRRIVVNNALQLYKKNKKIEVEPLDNYNEPIATADEDDTSVFEMIMQAGFTIDQLHAIINKSLSGDSKIVFNMFYIENYSHKEISEMLAIDYTTCRSKLLRAKQKLQIVMAEACNVKICV